MRKTAILFLSFIMLISSIGIVSASDYSETLDAVGILPEFAGLSDTPIKKDEFAFMTAKLVAGEQTPTDTAFADVDSTNQYSGYISYLQSVKVISGDENGLFNPKENVNIYMASKMLLSALGYDEFAIAAGGYPYGYTEVLSMLGIDKGVALNADGLLTQEGAVRLIHNALTMELNGIEYITSENEMHVSLSNSKNVSVLAKKFGISVYEGVVSDVNDKQTDVTIKITKNKYSSNPTVLESGMVKSFSFKTNQKAEEYLYAPCNIWVNEDDEIIKIAPQRGVEIKYAVITEINNTKQNYPIANIESIMLLDDEAEYDVSPTAILKYNGKNTQRAVSLIDKFAKLVIKDGEVLFIESWDLIDGGLIKASDGNTLTYIKDGKTAYLRNMASFDKVITIIEGRGANANEIKTDCLFSYYEEDDYLVIVVSEKKFVDVFNSVSDTLVTVGGTSYRKGNVYYSQDGTTFLKSGEEKLFNRIVAVYVNPSGYASMITAVESDAKTRKFYGFVTGVEMDNMDHDTGEIKVMEAKGEFPELTLSFTEKTVFNDNLTLGELATNAKDLKGMGVYVFEVNDAGRIISVSKPQPVYGYTSTDVAVSTIYDTALVSLSPNYLFFPNSQEVVVVYEKNGEFTLGRTTWLSQYNHHASTPIKARFFGEGRSVTPSLIVLASGTGSISEFGSLETYGIITNVTNIWSDSGNEEVEVSVLAVNGSKKYSVTKEYANKHKLEKNSVIKFRDDLFYSDNEFVILNDDAKASEEYKGYNYKLAKNPDEWILPSAWTKAVCESADELRLVVKNEKEGTSDSVLFHIHQNFIVIYDGNAPVNQFRQGTWNDIDEGDIVLYNNIWEGTRGVIVIK